MNTAKRAIISLGLVAVMGASACNRGQTVSRTIDGKTFNIPAEYLIETDIPWLPSSQSAALKFVINPKAKPEAQLIVTMESISTTCRPKTAPVSNQLPKACAAAMRSETDHSEGKLSLAKVYRDDSQTQWEYRISEPSAGSDGQAVASCYAMADGRSGLCTAISHYGKLVYSLGFTDAEIANLSRMHSNVRELLASWEQRT